MADSSQATFNFDEQRENLERVSSRIAPAILAFCGEHRRFHADDLRRHVIRETGIAAPASADRVLRALRQQNKLGYKVISRRESLYEVTWINGRSVA